MNETQATIRALKAKKHLNDFLQIAKILLAEGYIINYTFNFADPKTITEYSVTRKIDLVTKEDLTNVPN